MRTLSRLARWFHPFTDTDALDRLLVRFSALRGIGRVRARIRARVQEDADTVSLWLQPGRGWRGHVAGQHLLLEVEIDGRLQRRAFSLACAPRRGAPLRLTIRRSPRARVSDWAISHLQVGDVVGLGPAQGDFVLPTPTPARLLLLGAGSGMTPMIAMLEALADAGHDGDVVLCQLARDRSRRLFVSELAALRTRLPGLRVLEHISASAGHLAGDELLSLVPDLGARHLMMCGPSALMDDLQHFIAARGLATTVQRETFGPARAPIATTDGEPGYRAYRSAGGPAFTLAPGQTLLDAAEAAGLEPAHGCRAGICRTCLCEKRSGRTLNLLTGARSDEPGEWIQLCIHRAESDLELAL